MQRARKRRRGGALPVGVIFPGTFVVIFSQGILFGLFKGERILEWYRSRLALTNQIHVSRLASTSIFKLNLRRELFFLIRFGSNFDRFVCTGLLVVP